MGLVMEDMTDSETSLAWLWVIEAMASYKEVSLSLLHGKFEAVDFNIRLIITTFVSIEETRVEFVLLVVSDLVQAAPELPCGLVGNAKERIALRCLEDLFARQSRMTSDTPSAPGSKIGFGLSESCEDVLQQIVQEVRSFSFFFSFRMCFGCDMEN